MLMVMVSAEVSVDVEEAAGAGLMQSAALEHIVGNKSGNAGELGEPVNEGRGIQLIDDFAEQGRKEFALRKAELIFILVFIAGPGVGRHVGKFVGGFSGKVGIE